MKKFLHIYICCIILLNTIALYSQDFTNIASQKPFTFQGNMELRGMFYQANGIGNRMEPFNYLLSGSPVFSIYGWNIPTSFMISKKQSSFQQPFNQYGLSPTYKWITLHGGYRNVTFSPYTLAGHTMLGGGVELNPGKFRFGAMLGRLNRATVIDTASMSLVPYSFTRKGVALKLGYGVDANHFDINVLHAKDDSVSKPQQIGEYAQRVTPAANTVLGYGTKFTIFKRFFIESDGAVSVYTRDLNSPLALDSIPDKTLRRLSSMLDINGSTEWFLAFSGGIGYTGSNYGVKVNYKRIEPDFKSMGAYFFNNDIENLTISPNYSHPSGKFIFNGSLGIEQDNIRLTKQATSKRIIGSANLSTNLTESFGVDFIFNNYSNNQKPNTLRFADSLKIVQNTATLGIMPRYTIIAEDKIQVMFLSANFNTMNDYNSYFETNAPSRDIKSQQYLFNYNISFPQKRLSLNSSVNYMNLKSELVSTSYKGINAGGSFALENKKLMMGANMSFMLGENNGERIKIFNGSTNLSYQINRLQTIRALIYFTNNNPGSAIISGNPSFSETRGEIAYQLNFGL
ncbi:hypothetical protein [Sphingobacterium bovistauri]|uniref:DUF5723 domain-containing protein n=1 Tax=Sphingobacterium bovistauri TaxID=2781959 RepID=A0ABS7Z302_9SPHI|nr:hypothetical protein [Sphingobacterium bovistauri]MCA5004537.1 hypothetical protein [Sphingobacterium bovistauri]